MAAEAQGLSLEELETSAQGSGGDTPSPDEMAERQGGPHNTEVCPAGQVRGGTPELANAVPQLHEMATSRFDFEVDVVAKVELLIEVNAEVASLGTVVNLDVADSYLGRKIEESTASEEDHDGFGGAKLKASLDCPLLDAVDCPLNHAAKELRVSAASKNGDIVGVRRHKDVISGKGSRWRRVMRGKVVDGGEGVLIGRLPWVIATRIIRRRR